MNLRRLLLPIDICMVVFAVTGIIGIFTAYERSLSFPFGMTILLSVGLYFVTAYFVQEWEAVIAIAVVLITLGVIVALFFITQYGHQNYPETPDFILRIGQITTFLPNFGLMMHPNSAAMFVEAMIPLGVFMAISARENRQRLIWLICTFIMLYAVFLSFSRGGWIALALTLVIGLVTFSRAAAVITAVLVVVGAVTALVLGPERLSFLEGALSWTTGRYDLYRSSLYVISDYALTGVGLGDVFALIYSRYGLLIQVPALTYTHNLPLAVWFGQGIIGLIAAVGMVILLALFVLHVIAWSKPRRLFHGIWLGIVAALIHGLFDARQYAEPFWIMPILFIFIGLCAAVGRMSLQEATRYSRDVTGNYVPLFLPLGVVALIVVVSIIFFPKLRAAWATNLGALDETRSELTANLNDIQRTDLINSARRSYEAALNYDPMWAPATRRLGNLDVKQGQYIDALPRLEAAYAMEAGNQAAIKGLGLAYTWVGRTDEAAQLFEQLPVWANIPDELGAWANWRTGRNEFDLAAYAYETAAKLRPDEQNPILWAAIAQNYQRANRNDQAQIWYERVLAVEPDNEFVRNALAEITAP